MADFTQCNLFRFHMIQDTAQNIIQLEKGGQERLEKTIVEENPYSNIVRLNEL